MKKKDLFSIICLCSAVISLNACGTETSNSTYSDMVTTEISREEQLQDKNQIIIDYGDAESFEAALCAGENLEGKVVQFEAIELQPQSLKGYNVWAGEHLNFISNRNPDIKVGDIVAVKANIIESELGSWFITYDKVEDAITNENTIFADIPNENELDKSKVTDTVTSETNSSVSEMVALDTTVEKTEPESADDASVNNTYESNEYYEIVDTSVLLSTGGTIIIDKVYAKKTASVESTIIVFSEDGSVVGKYIDDIKLTEGQNNYFVYYIADDISNCNLDKKYAAQRVNYSSAPNAVEMVTYNKTEENLYITFKQVSDKLNYSSKFKILLYKEGKIVGAEDGSFSTYASNLNGKDSTDVVELWPYHIDYDDIEYIFEP